MDARPQAVRKEAEANPYRLHPTLGESCTSEEFLKASFIGGETMTEEEAKDLIENGEFNLDIPNFEKWNPKRKDKHGNIRTHQTRDRFVLHHSYWSDPKFVNITPGEELVWIHLLALRARSGKHLTNITQTWCKHTAGFRGTSVQVALLKLWKSKLIVLTSADAKKERKAEVSMVEIMESEAARICQEVSRHIPARGEERAEKRKNSTPPPGGVEKATNTHSREELEQKESLSLVHIGSSQIRKKQSTFPAPDISTLWNQFAPPSSTRLKLDPGAAITGLWVAQWVKHPTREYWLSVFKRVRKSKWLCDKPIGIKFFLANHPFILLGEYDDHGAGKKEAKYVI